MNQSRWENVQGRLRLYKDWYKVVFPLNRLLDRLGMKPVLHMRNGLALRVRIFSDDLPIINEVIDNDSYGLAALSLGECPRVVDIGANIGVFCVAVKHRFPDARLLAYEPHPANFSLLAQNAPFAELVQKAIAGAPGEVHIEASGHASAFRLADRGIAVEAATLEEVLAPLGVVALLKVDIEGSEYDVFTHTKPVAMEKVENAIVEVHRDEWRGWFEQFFQSCGFSVRWDKDLLLANR